MKACLTWDSIDAELPAQPRETLGYENIARTPQAQSRENKRICLTCPLPLSWCRGGEEQPNHTPCPFLRHKYGLPELTGQELAAIWVAYRSGTKVRDWWVGTKREGTSDV